MKTILPLLPLFVLLLIADRADSACKTIKRDRYLITVRKLDREQMVTNRIKQYKSMNLSDERIKELTSELSAQLKNNLYFSITVDGNPGKKTSVMDDGDIEYDSDPDNYSNNLRELLFGLGESIYLVDQSGNKIKPEIYNFERTFGLSTAKSLMVLFSKAKLEKGTRKVELIVDKIGPLKHRERIPFTI